MPVIISKERGRKRCQKKFVMAPTTYAALSSICVLEGIRAVTRPARV